MLSRHSSRRQPLDTGFLNARLEGATHYDRIAGYFSSSILEIAGEALESIRGRIRVVCNSGLSRADVEVAKAARAAMRREWCDSQPEDLGDAANSEGVDELMNMRFECVILDEAHRARRRNSGSEIVFGPAEPNNLLEFLRTISLRTRSLLLATATPVQLHPIEVYDLLDALACGSDAVLGSPGSRTTADREADPASG